MALSTWLTACTSSDASDPTTSTAPTSSPTTTEAGAEPPAVSINEALGGNQAVQDFAIYTGMWEADSGSLDDFYDDVVDLARSGGSDLRELTGGFTLAESEGLSAEIVEPNGQPLRSVTVDYGLMEAQAAVFDDSLETMFDDVEGLAGEILGEALAAPGFGKSPLLVEIITADFSEARTHVGPGDLVQLDLTAIESLAPGDSVAVSYLFGQTLPGDPKIESQLSPVDLFIYRWNQGLVRVLADTGNGDVVDFSDYKVELISGSTKLTREAKEAILLETLLETAEESRKELAERLNTPKHFGGTFFVDDRLGLLYIEPEDATDGSRNVYFVPPGWDELEDDPSSPCFDAGKTGSSTCFVSPQLPVPLDGLISIWALENALRECGAKAAQLNKQNGAATPVGDLLPQQSDGTDTSGSTTTTTSSSTTTTISESTTTTEPDDGDPLAPKPGTVSCGPPPESQFKIPKPHAGAAHGDIHINTIDRQHSSNQAVGEFLLFDNGVAEVQIRTEKFDEALPTEVSVVAAFAARIDGHKISMQGDGSTWIDDELVDLARGETVRVGTGEVLWSGQGWVVVWPDGTVLRALINDVFKQGVVVPAAGQAVGLLGNFDGDPTNDFFTRDGEVLDPDVTLDFEQFYGTYVNSWRITDEESAFHYDPGESTATFTDLDFPSKFASADDLAADVRAEAEELCRRIGITMEVVLADCILDVGATGEPSFAYQAFLAQGSISEPTEDATEPTGPGGNTLVMGDITVAFGPEPLIVDPTGVAPSWTCEVGDGVFTAFSSFPESPTINYDLEVQYIAPNNSRGLNESFRVIVRRNGENYAWVQTAAEQFANAVDSVSLQGATLVASGDLYVNDPPQPGLQPVSPLPGDAELTPFSLQTGCDG